MPLYKNQSGQWLDVFAWDTINNTWKTGDAGNITCAYKIDAGEIGSLADTNPAELDATDMPGAYRFDLAQGEINGDLALYYPKSSTPGILLEPVSVYTTLPGLTTEQKADVNAEADQALADYQGATQSNLTDAVSAIRGADGDTLKTLSDQLDTAQTDLDNPDQYKNDISGLATAAGLAAAVSPLATTAALNTHDGKLDQVKAKTDLIPAVPASQGDVSAVGVLVDTVDTVVDAIKTVTDKLDSTLEQDGDVYRLTSNALEQAPGGAGGGDATAANQTVIIGLINDVSAQIDDIGGQAGPGAIRWLYLLTEEGTNIPIADADIWVSTDEAQTNIIASGRTNQNGIVYFDLDEGTVYVWRQKSGWDFVNPQTKMVTP